jgi:hypothetical protein
MSERELSQESTAQTPQEDQSKPQYISLDELISRFTLEPQVGSQPISERTISDNPWEVFESPFADSEPQLTAAPAEQEGRQSTSDNHPNISRDGRVIPNR